MYIFLYIKTKQQNPPDIHPFPPPFRLQLQSYNFNAPKAKKSNILNAQHYDTPLSIV